MGKHLNKLEICSAPGMKARKGHWKFGLCKVKGIPLEAENEIMFTVEAKCWWEVGSAPSVNSS